LSFLRPVQTDRDGVYSIIELRNGEDMMYSNVWCGR
jgi:acyl-CoA thioesterase